VRKNLLIMLAALLLTFFSIVPSFASQAPKVVLNGQTLTFDVPPSIINGYTYVPVRTIFESLGCIVFFDSATKTVGAASIHDGTKIELKINGNALVNSTEVHIDAPAQLISGRTMVPLRFVGESLGADVNWDKQSNTISISDEKCSLTISEETYQNDSYKISLPKDWIPVFEDNQEGAVTSIFSKENNELGGINAIMVIETEKPDTEFSTEEISEAFIIGLLEQQMNDDMSPSYELISKETVQINGKDTIFSEHFVEINIGEEGINISLPLKIYILSTESSEKLFCIYGIWMDPQTKRWAPVLKESILSFETLDSQN